LRCRRKNAIGGWLLYFLAYGILDALATVVNILQSLDTYTPGHWQGNRVYLPFMLGVVPSVVIVLALMVATSFWFGREIGMGTPDALLLAALIIAKLVRLGIDFAFFPSQL